MRLVTLRSHFAASTIHQMRRSIIFKGHTNTTHHSYHIPRLIFAQNFRLFHSIGFRMQHLHWSDCIARKPPSSIPIQIPRRTTYQDSIRRRSTTTTMHNSTYLTWILYVAPKQRASHPRTKKKGKCVHTMLLHSHYFSLHIAHIHCNL